MSRVLWLRLGAVLLASGLLYGRSDTAPYTQVARVPAVVDGQGLTSFAFDPVDPPSGRMHDSLLAPELSATSRIVLI